MLKSKAASSLGSGCRCGIHAVMDQVHSNTVKLPQPANLVGTWRRFGAAGPVYEIIGAGHPLPDGDFLMRIRVVESGEEVDYRLGDILDDPRER